MSLMQSALRITDRFYDLRDPESIERQGRLQNCIVLVFILHMTMVIAFIKLQEYEAAHPRVIRDVDVSFEFTPPPPEPPPEALEMPRAISLTEGENANPGSEAAPSALTTDSLNLPAVKAPALNETPTNVPARPVPSRKTTMAPPVALTPTNLIKAPQGIAVKQAPSLAPPPPVAGNTSTQPLSGAANTGGVGVEGGVGTGGVGAGGTGTGTGDLGAGSGTGAAGGPAIATRLPSSAARAMGNIAPYRKDLLVRLAQNWHPKKSYESLIVLITVDHGGKLLSSEIFQSSGSKKADKEAMAAVDATEFAPLPEWYKGESLTFRIELSKVESVTQ